MNCRHLKYKDVKYLLERGEFVLFIQKTDSHRKTNMPPDFKHDLLNLEIQENEENKLMQCAGDPRSSMHPLSYITIVNMFIYRNSFKQELLTEAKGMNVQIIAKMYFIKYCLS